ncbi:metallophosphoesterase [bacterium]|nr:metallophosphoesterase [bacterium]
MKRELRRGTGRAGAGLVLAGAALVLCAFVWPWDREGPWPEQSDLPVEPLGFPPLESMTPKGKAPAYPLRFAAFGDQRALADGEWQQLLAYLAEEDRRQPLSFLIDTGDIVYDGSRTNQFAHLRGILEPVSHLPYLVCVGNHESCNNAHPRARSSLATLLRGVAPGLTADRLYYRKDIGPLRILFLDTNDLTYGDDGMASGRRSPRPGSRAETQLRWLEEELAGDERGPDALTIVVMHHPFLQSSAKHRPQAIALWSYRWNGRALPGMLLDGGVDLVLAGHTHTTERFHVRRTRDGAELTLLNVSGRPRDGYLWFGAGARKAKDIAGKERAWLAEQGWPRLDGWEIEQRHAMVHDATNQCAMFTMDADGGLGLEIVYVEKDGDVRRDPAVRIR